MPSPWFFGRCSPSLGAQASVRESNAVRMAADRLRLLKGEGGSSAARFGPPVPGTGIITGTVTNATTAAPIASVVVYIFDCAGTYLTPAPGDFDGDAKADLGVYDEASGLWFSRSVSGSATTTTGFGGPGYKPVVIP